MTRNRSVSTQPDSTHPIGAARAAATRMPLPVALILGGAVLTVGWTAFLGWLLYATFMWTIG